MSQNWTWEDDKQSQDGAQDDIFLMGGSQNGSAATSGDANSSSGAGEDDNQVVLIEETGEGDATAEYGGLGGETDVVQETALMEETALGEEEAPLVEEEAAVPEEGVVDGDDNDDSDDDGSEEEEMFFDIENEDGTSNAPEKVDFFPLVNSIDDVKAPVNGEFDIPQVVQEKHAELVVLILETKSMDDKERQYWFHILPVMNDDQIEKLRNILENEKTKLAELNAQDGGAQTKAESAPIDEGKIQEDLERVQALEARDKESETQKEADLLAELDSL